ncbi:hypothetical protein [Laceyella sacchari]|uniref:Uncharacterized protein n=1 Tax=Laceyella sacchari TaxID=37482 RepID=A0ABY5U2D8_LACSH|nr:hypothetical protein [Laceyella sacchari]UWE02223.1 hypothetical protein NYR52_08380 [Laceyella sacchari]
MNYEQPTPKCLAGYYGSRIRDYIDVPPLSGQYVILSAKEADGLSISFIRGLQQG